jgi:hypothetical protein
MKIDITFITSKWPLPLKLVAVLKWNLHPNKDQAAYNFTSEKSSQHAWNHNSWQVKISYIYVNFLSEQLIIYFKCLDSR